MKLGILANIRESVQHLGALSVDSEYETNL